MSAINIGDAVTMVELWPNKDTGALEPTDHPECRFYGYVRSIIGNQVVVTSELEEPIADGLTFPISAEGLTKGDVVAYRDADIGVTFPHVQHDTSKSAQSD